MPGEKPSWHAVLGELIATTDENILLSVIKHDKILLLDETSEGPHCMTPENMLKSMTVQILIEKTGEKYSTEIDKLQSQDATLNSIIQWARQNGRSLL